MSAQVLAIIFGAILFLIALAAFIGGIMHSAGWADNQMDNFKPIEFEGIKTKLEEKI